MKISPFLLVVSVLSLVAVAVTLGQSAPAPSAIPTRFAAVDTSSVFDHLDDWAAGTADLEKMAKDLNDEGNRKQKAVDDLKAQLASNLFKPGSDEYKKMQYDYLQKQIEVDSFVKFGQAQMAIEQGQKVDELYRKINAAIAQYAKSNGIAMVFVTDNPNFPNAHTPEARQTAISTRKVMYADSNYDITRKIIEQMNADRMMGPK